MEEGLVVVGTGEASAAPNVVRITLGVEAQNPDAQAAVAEANAKMAAIIEALKRSGVDPKDIRTSQFEIHSEEPPPRPMYEVEPMPAPPPGAKGGVRVAPAPPPPEAPPQRQVIFRVSNTALVTLRNLDKVGETLGTVVNAGANRAWGISFEIEDPKPIVEQARVKAVEDAKRRAEELARLSGVKLGRPLHVSEGMGGDMPPPMPYGMPQAMRAEAGAVPVERGELKIVQTVRIVYAIAE
jgi:uncharacterized protein YggE